MDDAAIHMEDSPIPKFPDIPSLQGRTAMAMSHAKLLDKVAAV